MAFVFDPSKGRQNLAKHGIDFVAAQRLWRDPNVLQIPARIEAEPREIVIGIISRQLWAAVVTFRDGDVRIISVRRARRQEVALYESREIR